MPRAPKDKERFDPQELQNAFSYDPITGLITRNHDSIKGRVKAGDIAGYKEKGSGRDRISYRGRSLLAYRVGWAIYYGAWPEAFLDHINGDESDNRIANLREASHKENTRNRKTHAHSATGVKGVALENGRFCASITSNGVRTRLGGFASISEADAAYKVAAKRFHGEFARHDLSQSHI